MRKYLTILLLSALCGCELVVDVDIPIEKQTLVLNSFFNPDSTWKAKISLSRHILDDAPYPFVTDAHVIVYEEETPLDTLQHDSLGYYRSNSGGPRPGKNYSIRASTPDYGTATASSACPRQIECEFSPVTESVGEFGETEYSFSITFNDSPGNNFYQVMGIGEHRYTNPQTGQGFLNRSNLRIWSDDEGIDEEEIQNSEGFFFSDVLFDRENFTVNVKMTPNAWYGNVNAKYFIYFREVSRDYYKYKATSLVQNYTAGDPFAQPVKVYNNIENGFGIFAGYTQNVLMIEK